MSRKIKFVVFIPLLFLAVSFLAHANGQEQLPPSIDSSTSKSFYNHGEMVFVNGKIKNYDDSIHSDYFISYNVTDPNGVMVSVGQTEPNSYGTFSFKFVAVGEPFKPNGNYNIQMLFGDIAAELPLFISGGKPDPKDDDTPPKILQQVDIIVEAQSQDTVTQVTFDVMATDDIDEKVRVTCKPSSGFLFGIGETVVKCTAKDSAGNFATPISFTVKVNPPNTTIPEWVKNVATFWCENEINDGSFVEAIQFLINNEIIVVPGITENYNGTQEIPQWVKNTACWWSSGSITDGDFAYGIEYLVRQGIIRV